MDYKIKKISQYDKEISFDLVCRAGKNIRILYQNFEIHLELDKVHISMNNMLLARCKDEDIEFTNLYKDKLNQITQDKAEIENIYINDRDIFKTTYDVFKYLVSIIEKVETKKLRHKIKNTTFYEQIDIPSLGIRYNKYMSNEKFVVKESSSNTYKILVNNEDKDILEIPSQLYPFPAENPHIYTNQNTENLSTDEVSDILKDFCPLVGQCHQNAKKIYNILKNSEFSKAHNIELKIGWFCNYYTGGKHTVLHSWVVIDNKHLLDTTSTDIELMNKWRAADTKGEILNISRRDVAEELARKNKSDAPFKEKYCYGKVLENSLYIGVTVDENFDGFKYGRKLFEQNPSHPAFEGLNLNTGKNKLQEITEYI